MASSIILLRYNKKYNTIRFEQVVWSHGVETDPANNHDWFTEPDTFAVSRDFNSLEGDQSFMQ